MRRRRLHLLLASALLGALLFTAWVFRSPLQRWLAAPEADFTARAKVARTYPRPHADLTPVWGAPLQRGYGGAAIAEDEVLVLDREPGVGDTLRAFALEDGAPRWSFAYDAPGRLEFPGSRTTPAVAGEAVYTLGPFGQVHCVDRRTHAVVWSADLERDLGGTLPEFGWAATPLVVGECVVLPALGEAVGLVALDRRTGALAWRTPPLGRSHSTPVLVELLGRPQVLFVSSEVQGLGLDVPAPMTVSAFDPGSGALQWQVRTLLTSVPIPPPVRVDERHLFLTGGYGGGSTLLRLRRDEGAYAVEEVFHIEKGAQLHPPVVLGEHVYLLANENSNDSRRRRHQGGLSCFDLEGEELWSTGDDPYFGRGHYLGLGSDHLLIQDGLSGMLRLARVGPDGYTQVATANVFEAPPKARRRMWAPMARQGDLLVVRGEDELRCVRLGDSRAAGR